MLHTKFRGNRLAGSGEEDFGRVSTIYGYGGHLGHVTSIILINFHFHVPKSLLFKIWLKLPGGFREKQVLIFKCKWPWTKVIK